MASAHAHDSEHGHGDGRVHAHVSSWQFLLAIFGALIFLTVITVAVSYVDLGSANTLVAVLVATIKATLVATFFMHLSHDKPFHAIILVMSFVFLIIFLLLAADDIFTRGEIDPTNGVPRLQRSEEMAPGGFVPQPSAPAEEGGHEAPAHH